MKNRGGRASGGMSGGGRTAGMRPVGRPAAARGAPLAGGPEKGTDPISSIHSQKNKRATLATQLVAGTRKRLSTVGSLTFDGGTFAPDTIEKQLTLLTTLRDDV